MSVSPLVLLIGLAVFADSNVTTSVDGIHTPMPSMTACQAAADAQLHAWRFYGRQINKLTLRCVEIDAKGLKRVITVHEED